MFSGYTEPFFIASGLISCLIAVFFAKRMNVVDEEHPVFLMPMVPFYLIWLYKEIIKSAIDVSFRVWKVEPDISPVIAWVPSSQTNDASRATYANSITLTPGTVCIDVTDNSLEVHALSHEGIDGLLEGVMDKKVTETMG